MVNKTICAGFVAALGALALSTAAATAGELPRTHFKVVGTVSTANQYKYQERPFFLERIPERSNGRVTVTLTAQDEMGLKGPQIIRLVRMGVLDIAKATISKMAGDDRYFDGIDLAGLTSDLGTARKVVDAYKPVIAERLANKHNIKLLSIAPVTMQVLYCKPKITGLADLKGKKVRVFNAPMANFVEAAGAASANIPFVEVIPALQRGVVDCAITGTSNGNTTRWWEVTDYLYPMSLGWSMFAHVANMDFWNRLDAQVQEFLLEEFVVFEKNSWEQARKDLTDGIHCNTGTGPCNDGIAAKPPMTLAKPSAEDEALRVKIVKEIVVPKWAKVCGRECVRTWNKTIGKVVNITAPTN